MISIQEAASFPYEQIKALPLRELRRLGEQVEQLRFAMRQGRQLEFYQPVSDEARKIHLSMAKEVLVTGGNRSSKTDSLMAELAIQMTGIVPRSLKADYPREKIRPPIRARITCQSLINTWEPVIKPKLQWNKWSGRGEVGGAFGHWGWIPQEFLIKGKWEESWSEKNRTLTLSNGSTVQISSYDQDVENFSGGSFHLIIHDEGPPHSIYRENKMRTLDVGGRLMIAMTPPDDESAAWDAAWVYDELYERGLSGPGKDPDIDSFTLFTEDNRILDRKEIEKLAKGLTANQREVRLFGRFLHLSGRIYPIYTDRPQHWCFQCGQVSLLDGKRCVSCENEDTTEFCHFVEPFEKAYDWPIVYLLDPHPRKPNIMCWVAVSPGDDWFEIGDMEVDGSPEQVRIEVENFERAHNLYVAKRLIDPNMAESPAHSAGRRHVTVRDEFDAVGLRCDLADDAFMVGKARLTERFKPDPKTREPRLQIFRNCSLTNRQLLRYVWAEWARYSSETKDPKPIPMAKNDDLPTLLRYLANSEPTYTGLTIGTMPIRTGRKRTGSYG